MLFEMNAYSISYGCAFILLEVHIENLSLVNHTRTGLYLVCRTALLLLVPCYFNDSGRTGFKNHVLVSLDKASTIK